MFLTTGYMVTTAILRAIWKGSKLWLYSMLATALLLLHFEVLNIGLGGAFAPADRAHIRVAGACIAFLTTLAGTTGLRRLAALRASRQSNGISVRSP